jgi:hypothetical protein
MPLSGTKIATFSDKTQEKGKKIFWNGEKCLTLQRQEEILGYPGKFPAWGNALSILPI